MITQEEAELRLKKYNLTLISNYVGIKQKIRVKCHCGQEFSIRPDSVFSGRKQSCGCESFIDLTGREFGLLKVIRRVDSEKHGQWWLCECKCGGKREVITNHLIQGATISCGCLLKRTKSSNPCWKGYGEISGQFWCDIKHGAKRRNLAFEISIEEAWNLFVKQKCRCELSGIEIFFSKSYNHRGTASLDRIHSDQGYVGGNVQWIHKRVNKIKQDLSEVELLSWCKLLIETSERNASNASTKQKSDF